MPSLYSPDHLLKVTVRLPLPPEPEEEIESEFDTVSERSSVECKSLFPLLVSALKVTYSHLSRGEQGE